MPEQGPTCGGRMHTLKAWPDGFSAVIAGDKRHEYRVNDRAYACGDLLHLREFVPCPECWGTLRVWDSGDKFPCDCSITNNPGGTYTGREATVRVTYVTDCEMWGGREGHVCLSIAKKDEDDRARHIREAVEAMPFMAEPEADFVAVEWVSERGNRHRVTMPRAALLDALTKGNE